VHRQPDDIEIATLDAVYEARGESLNSVATGFVKGFARVNVVFDFSAGQLRKVNDSILQVQPGLSSPSEANCRVYVMWPPGKQGKHPASVFAVRGLFEDVLHPLMGHCNGRVRGEDAFPIGDCDGCGFLPG
jgi:hypothetical protein